MQLFYLENISESVPEAFFDREESKHIVRVLRKQAGDLLHVTDGKGNLYSTEIQLATDQKCVVKIVSAEKSTARPYSLHLAVAPTKMNERYEWFLEKATEIGINEITPLICDHSERKVIKAERFEKIILAAMKQSLQTHLPQLHPAKTFKEWISEERDGIKLIAHCGTGEKHSLATAVTPQKKVTLLIGPEGDFSPAEIQQALEAGYTPVSLGDTRLRTETAAIVACHSIAFINQQ